MALTLLGLNKSTEIFAKAEERAGMTILDLGDARREEGRRQADALVPVQQAIGPELMMLGGGDVEDARYRRITSPNTRRDLSPIMQERMQKICFFLAMTTPFGKRFVELMTSYVVGADGFELTAEDENVQVVLDNFTQDEVNRFQETVRDWSDELCRLGEVCVPVATNAVSGQVRYGYVDPCDIEAIEYGLLTAGDGREEISIPVAVRLRQRIGEQQGRRLTIVRRDEDPNSPTFGRLAGDCFYLPVNKAKGGSRGISDLFNLADWLDVLDQIVFDAADRVRFLNSFVWHYIIKGGDEKKLDEFRKKTFKSPPRQGGVITTNEQVEIKGISPDLKAQEMGETIGNVKTYGLGGMGFPNHWFADPGDVNRATAGEMGEPTLKKLEDRQSQLKRFVLNIAAFVVEQAQNAGVLADDVDTAVSVVTPKLNKKDLSKGATTVQTTSGALATAEDRGWIRGETAARAFHQVLREIDVEVDSSKEYEEAQKEKLDRDARSQDSLNAQRNLADALRQLPAAPEPQPAGAVQ